jgi:hypothetical protein
MWAGFEQAAAADQPKHAPVAIDQLTDQASTIQSLDQLGVDWSVVDLFRGRCGQAGACRHVMAWREAGLSSGCSSATSH